VLSAEAINLCSCPDNAALTSFSWGSVEVSAQEHQGNAKSFKVLTSVTGNVKNFPWISSAKAQGQRRAAALLHGKRRKIKLWEEPDQKLVTDDVRGGGYSFWAEWH
jgi:hypothetical protein